MSDQEIAILIKAVDEATTTLKNIEKSIDNTAKSSEKANERLSSSFTQVQGAMLNLGQVAQGVHNIFEIQENSTRRLENAQDRLENASIRLKQANQALIDTNQKLLDIEKKHERDSLSLERAQLNLESAFNGVNEAIQKYGENSLEARQAVLRYKEAQMDLTDAQKLGEQKSKELAQAQQELKDKQDAIVISSNNLDRAQRQLDKTIQDLKWSYLDMGMQVLSVAGNIAVLSNALRTSSMASSLTSSSMGLAGLGGSLSALGPYALAAGIALGGLYLVMKTAPVKETTENFDKVKESVDALRNSANLADQAIGKLLEQEARLQDFYVNQGYSKSGPGMTMSGEELMSEESKTKLKGIQAITTSYFTRSIVGGKSEFERSIELANTAANNTFPNLDRQLIVTKDNVDKLGTYIGSDKKGSFPIVYSLGLASEAWNNMTELSIGDIGKIIESINSIPTEYVTVHRIVTVYGNDSSVKGGAVKAQATFGGGGFGGKGAGR